MVRYRNVVAFCAVALLWGLSLAAVEVGLRSFPPLLLSAFRYYIGGAILLSYVGLVTERWYPRTRTDVVAICGGGVFWIAIGNGVWFVGQGLTTSVLSGLMMSLTPIATVAVSWTMLPEDRLTVASMVGLFVSFSGAVLMVWPSDLATVTAALVGKALLFVGVLGLAIGSVLIRWASAPLPSTARTAWSVLVGAVVIHVLSVLAGEQWAMNVTTTGIASVLYLGVGATAIGYVLFFGLLDRYPAIEVNLVTYLVPIVATVAGWTLFEEHISWRMPVGFLVIAIGFCLMKRRELRVELERIGYRE
ncbi:DMT family transporter [Haladaptatus sp. DYF46]|uniref:DMT family transporter n=1 Tax=Haladaptatus sp. DYF46 TaxID=2886041 RepID=UPI001E4F8D70|nr:DMT family transporter [Haladaptatus sp. DYF46]